MNAARVSKRTLSGMIAADDLPDQRAIQVRSLGVAAREAAEEQIGRIFTGTDLATDMTKVGLIVEAVQVAQDAFNKIAENYLAICTSLFQLSTRLTPREFAMLRANAESLFPFSKAQASMFRKIGEAVADSRLDPAQVPRDWTTAYQLATLTEAEFALAQQRGLVRRDVVRREIDAFRREVRPGRLVTIEAKLAGDDVESPAPSMATLRRDRRERCAELDAVEAEQRQLLATLATLNKRRRALRDLLADDTD